MISISSQRGASVTGVVLLLIFIVIAGKLVIAIVPDQIGDYQLTKLLKAQLIEANNNEETAKEFTERINRQLSINADYDTKAEEVFTFTNKTVGQLAIRKSYATTNNFFANVDIVNRFEGDIDTAAAQ